MKSSDNRIFFSIAGVNCCLTVENEKLSDYFKERYSVTYSVKIPKINILIKREEDRYIVISTPFKLTARLPLTTIKEGINSIIVAFVEFNFLNKKVVLLHELMP